jgi:hypothetical protein
LIDFVRLKGDNNKVQSPHIMPSTTKPKLSSQEWIAIFESASRRNPDEINSQWELLMEHFGLGPEYFLAIHEALRQGRWRKAKDPKAYIKTVAKREAQKMGLLSEQSLSQQSLSQQSSELVLVDDSQVDGEDASSEEILDFISYQRDSSAPVKGPNGVWRSRECLDREFENPIDESSGSQGGIPDEFQIHELPPEEYKKIIDKLNDMTGPDWDYIHLRPVTKPDWEKWAQAAGFDLWEQQVLNFKTARISRERALKQQPDEISRKALQAAWKRFDRGGMNRLRAAAKKNSTKNVPEP